MLAWPVPLLTRQETAMEAAKGYYSLIQYCPDPSRAEAATIGVVLFCPDRRFIEAKTAAGNDRIRRFFGAESLDRRRLNTQKRSLEDRIRLHADEFRTLGDLQVFIDTRANELVLTAPRSMKVLDPRRDLDNLFMELVGGRARKEKRQPVIPELDCAAPGRTFPQSHPLQPACACAVCRNRDVFPICIPERGTEPDQARTVSGRT